MFKMTHIKVNYFELITNKHMKMIVILNQDNFQIVDHFGGVSCEFETYEQADEMIKTIKSHAKYSNLNLISIEQK